MRKIIIKYILILAVIYSLLPTNSYSLTHIETITYKHKAHDTTISLQAEHRNIDDAIFYRHYDFGVQRPLNFIDKSWSISGHFRTMYTKNASRLWSQEKRPYGQIQKTFHTLPTNWLPELKWGLRTRHEYRIRENGNDTARNRLRIKLDSTKSYFNVKPFISEEIFYDFDQKHWSRSRTDIGFSLPQFKHANSTINYRLDKNNTPNNVRYISSIVFRLGF